LSIKVDAREKGALMDDEVVMQSVGDSIGKKSRSLLLDLVSLLGIVHQSLALFIAVVLVSESVAATPKPFSPSEQNYIVQGKRQKAKYFFLTRLEQFEFCKAQGRVVPCELLSQ
jgi:hypothetical protein